MKEAIDLAQAKHAKDSDDWGTIVNLGLYHLGAGNPVESDRFYRSLLNAPKEMIEMGIKDLEELREWRIANGELKRRSGFWKGQSLVTGDFDRYQIC